MNKFAMLLTTLTLSLTATLTLAESAPADAPKRDGKHGMMEFKTVDCSKAKEEKKARCEARNNMVEKCKDKAEGDERRACVKENMPKRAAKE